MSAPAPTLTPVQQLVADRQKREKARIDRIAELEVLIPKIKEAKAALVEELEVVNADLVDAEQELASLQNPVASTPPTVVPAAVVTPPVVPPSAAPPAAPSAAPAPVQPKWYQRFASGFTS